MIEEALGDELFLGGAVLVLVEGLRHGLVSLRLPVAPLLLLYLLQQSFPQFLRLPWTVNQ